jgi:cardiolipin synthase
VTLLELAEERIRITTAFFVPDEGLTGRLCSASDRGVSVEILLPGPHGDKRFVQLAGQSVYEELLTHGVRIWHFQPSMLHAKVMTVDRQVASIGSANFNARSIELDEEINLVALDRPLVRLLDDQFDEDLERSEEIDPSRWEERSLARRALVGLTKPLRHSV